MPGQERIERRPQVHAPECHRRGNPQRAGQRAAPLGHFRRGVLHFPQDPGGTFQERGAVFRQADPPCGAVKQARAQPLLNLGQPLADYRLRQVQPPRRLRNRPGLGHRHETRHAFKFEHCSVFPKSRIVISTIPLSNPSAHTVFRRGAHGCAEPKSMDQINGNRSTSWND
ncbi:hypothetical protein D3C81_1313770 [compost metagenome]